MAILSCYQFCVVHRSPSFGEKTEKENQQRLRTRKISILIMYFTVLRSWPVSQPPLPGKEIGGERRLLRVKLNKASESWFFVILELSCLLTRQLPTTHWVKKYSIPGDIVYTDSVYTQVFTFAVYLRKRC